MVGGGHGGRVGRGGGGGGGGCVCVGDVCVEEGGGGEEERREGELNASNTSPYVRSKPLCVYIQNVPVSSVTTSTHPKEKTVLVIFTSFQNCAQGINLVTGNYYLIGSQALRKK